MMTAQTQCTEQRPFIPAMTLVICAMWGQQFAEAWLEDHPKWKLLGWRCETNIPKRIES
jgi:hypothetical protein